MRECRNRFWQVGAAATVAAVVLACGTPVRAQDSAAAAQDLELRYVDGLNKLGLPTYAQLVLDKLGAGPEVKARRLESALQRGEFEQVIATIAAEGGDPSSLTAWAMKLKLADGYFAWGKYPEARKIYDEFFVKYASGAPAELKNFYYESAYKYAQMLLLMNDSAGAINAYRLGIKGTPPREIKRQFQGDLSDLLMKLAEGAEGAEREKLLTEINGLADELLWIQDLWFGKAIVLKAHIAMLRGDVDSAMKLVDDYRDQLVQIDQILQEQSPDGELTRMSPMAQARYLLGSILLDTGKKALAAGDKKKAEELLAGKELVVVGQQPRKLPGAFAHFINVFVRYPNTKWAIEAGAKAEEARTILERDLGKKISVNIEPAQWRKVEDEQIKNAKAAFNQQQFAEAADLYTAVLNRFPETDSSVPALADLATCHIELKNDLYADTVIAYMSERYNRNARFGTTAGNYVLSFASAYGERGRPERKDAVYEIYFRHFTEHPMAAQLLYRFGDRKLKEEDVAGAMKYYERVVKEHARSPVSFLALSKMAVCYGKMGDSTNQIRTLQAYVDRADKAKRLNHELIRVIYSLGSAYRELGPTFYGAAVKRYQDIELRLTTARESYQRNAQETQRNDELLANALFWRGVCYARSPVAEGKSDEGLKKAALVAFMSLYEKYPQSQRAPSALSQVGTLWTVMTNSVEAQKAFTLLKEKYPESVEARNVDFQLGMSLLALGKRPEAVGVFKQMFAGGGKYSDTQILTAGNELLRAKEYEIAAEAFDRVLANAKPDERAKQEPSLAGKGRALVALGRYAEGVAVLDTLFTQYPRSIFTVDGEYARSKAYAELAAVEADPTNRFDRFNQAIASMKEVMKYDTSSGRRGEATVEIGRINELKAQAEGQFGKPEDVVKYRDAAIATYQTMILFEKADDAAMRPHLEEAFYRCLRLFLDSERWQDLYGDAGNYLKVFPNGKHALEIRQWRSRAGAQLAAQGGPSGDAVPTASGAATPAAAPAPAPEPASAPAETAPAAESAPAGAAPATP
jgi:tetratricopeptide (TPR) repeat protein